MTPPTTTTEIAWADVLGAIAAHSPWFPSEFSATSGISRDLLDEPLNGLRASGLIEVVDWVKGKGQGYALTTAGREALKLPTLPNPQPVPKPKPELEGPTTFERGESARQALYQPRAPLATPLFIALIVIWFLVGIGMVASQSLGAYLRGQDSATAYKLGAVSGLALLQGQWWRLVSSIFVHMGLVHLAMNLMGLASIGGLVENLWGRVRFMVITLASGTAGAAVAMMFRPDSLLAGASGAIWGLLLSVPAWLLSYRMHLPPDHVQDIGRRLGIGILINGGISFAPGISFEAHFAGGAIGFLTAVALDAVRPDNKRKALPAAGVLVLLPLLFAMGMKRGMDRSSAWAPLRYVQEQRTKPNLTVEWKVAVPTYESVARWHQELTTSSAFNIKGKLKTLRPAFETYASEVGKFQALSESMGMKPAVKDYAREMVALCEALKVLATDNATAADRARANTALKAAKTAWERLELKE
jgi:membrane associated rhomboid family serine protease